MQVPVKGPRVGVRDRVGARGKVGGRDRVGATPRVPQNLRIMQLLRPPLNNVLRLTKELKDKWNICWQCTTIWRTLCTLH